MVTPQEVKLFVGMLSRERELFPLIENVLIELYGPVDSKSPLWQWTYTTYYDKEMGSGLLRRFIFFTNTIRPEALVDIKLKTREIEKCYVTEQGGRRINLDPGYLNTAKIVLASTKDFSHRIYLGRGIFTEVTLFFSKGRFRAFPYTFPDYTTDQYRELFEQVRLEYKNQMKS